MWALEVEHGMFKSIFESADKDKDGYVTLADVLDCPDVNSVLEEYEIQQLFEKCDFGGQERLDAQCFTLL